MISDDVREYLHTAPANRLSLPHCADSLGWSSSYLSKLLRKEGHRFRYMVIDERRRRAEELLKKNRRADAAAFCRVTGYRRAQVSRSIKAWFGMGFYELRESGVCK